MKNLFSENLKTVFFVEGGYPLTKETKDDKNIIPIFSLDLNDEYQKLLNFESIMVGDLFFEKKTETIFIVGLMQTINPSPLHLSSFRGISVIPFKLDNVVFKDEEHIVNHQHELSWLKNRELKYMGNIYMDESKKALFEIIKVKYDDNVFNTFKTNVLYVRHVIGKNMKKVRHYTLDDDGILLLNFDLDNLDVKNALYIRDVFEKEQYSISLILQNGINLLSNTLLILENGTKMAVGLNDIGIPILYSSDNKTYLTSAYLNNKVKKVIEFIASDKDEQEEFKSELLHFLSK